jgi:hypothetical protein
MKKSINAIITIVLVAIVAAACNLPFQNQPAAVETPNATLTALFNTNINIPATITPIYIIVTNTPEPVVATNTSAPTNTPEPTNTSAPTTEPTKTNTSLPPAPPVNPRGPVMEAGYISFDPTIDGSWAEWKDYTTQYPVTSVVYGASNWKGSADLEASYAAVWDYDYLYIGVKVHDDKYVQNAKGQDLYLGDSIEILLDTNFNGDYYTQSLSSDDYQLGISAGNNDDVDKEAFLWFPSSKAGDRSNVDIGFTTEEGIYRIEARIPWSVFSVTPAKGMHLGIAVSVSDNDDSEANKQQTMVSSAPNRHLLNPTTWGEIVLNK